MAMMSRNLRLWTSVRLWSHVTRSLSSVPETSEGSSLDAFVSSLSQPTSSRSFASLLRHSKFMQLGDFDGRLVTGKIVHRVGDDLYIDFGLKFNAVCQAPAVGGDEYAIGATVLLRLHDPELSERFLGSKIDLTLLEASATLVRLLRTAHGEKPKSDAGAQRG